MDVIPEQEQGLPGGVLMVRALPDPDREGRPLFGATSRTGLGSEPTVSYARDSGQLHEAIDRWLLNLSN